MPDILELHAEQTTFPMRSPFESARRRSSTARNVRVSVRLAGGAVGYGEGSPTDYVTGETAESVLDSMSPAADALVGADAARTARWAAVLREALPDAPTARSAVEMALLDALARHWRVPLWIFFGGAAREVRTDLSLTISAPEEAGAAAAAALAARDPPPQNKGRGPGPRGG